MVAVGSPGASEGMGAAQPPGAAVGVDHRPVQGPRPPGRPGPDPAGTVLDGSAGRPRAGSTAPVPGLQRRRLLAPRIEALVEVEQVAVVTRRSAQMLAPQQ